MFGYVGPYKMEMKVRDYEKFNSYYCGLCIAIKKNYGNLPRFSLNYDMTFLGILIDSLDSSKVSYIKGNCIAHPLKHKNIIIDNPTLDYAAFCNICLTYHKLMDDYRDDKSVKSKLFGYFLNSYLKNTPSNLQIVMDYTEKKLNELYIMEHNSKGKTLDELSHSFADLTGFIISNYITDTNYKLDLYWFGYNLGKWIYIIDAYDDLEKDMYKNKFNALNVSLNANNLSYNELKPIIEERVDFTLTSCARQCYESFLKLPIKKNVDLLENILHYGLLNKMNLVFKRSEFINEKSL